jgi:FMN phosphatase YigB (HAD superfamily)
VRSKGSALDDEAIINLYRACYRDGATAASFWEAAACDSPVHDLEADLFALYELRTGVIEFLEAMRVALLPLFGLSNDVPEWSLSRRNHFGIEPYFESWVVSGAERVIKPDPRIYQILIDRLPCAPAETLFVDDSPRNLEGAAVLGLQTAHFSEAPVDGHHAVASFEELAALVRRLR